MSKNLERSQIGIVIDWLTTIAIAAIAICITQIIHEGLHLLTCLAVGAELQEFSALHVMYESETELQTKLVSASASIINIIVAGITLLLLRRSRKRTRELQYFLWLFMVMNGLLGTSYWLFSGVANVGDWAYVIEGWTPHWLWRLVMAIIGLVSYTFAVWFSLHEFGKIIGGTDEKMQIRRATRLGLLSYITVFVVILLAGLFNSHGITGLPAVAALLLALGGMSPLLWMMQWFQAKMFKKIPNEPLVINRRWNWVIAAIIITIVYSFILGRGLVFV